MIERIAAVLADLAGCGGDGLQRCPAEKCLCRLQAHKLHCQFWMRTRPPCRMLQYEQGIYVRNRWTDEEKAKLAELDGNKLTREVIARMIGRSKGAVEYRCRKLGLRRRRRRDKKTTEHHAPGP